MDTPDITVEEWRKALEAAGATEGKGLTTDEWADLLKCAADTFAKKRKTLMRAGKMVHGGFRWETSADGKPYKAPVYRLVLAG